MRDLRMRRGAWAVAFVMVAVAPGCFAPVGGGSSGEPSGCTSDADCGAATETCQVLACEDHACVSKQAPAGTACQGGACNADGVCIQCKKDSDCFSGDIDSACGSESCISGQCVLHAAAYMTACPAGICDGSGHCAECFSPSDCPSPKNACDEATCDANHCGSKQRDEGATCGFRGVCESGACVECGGQTCATMDDHEPNDTQAKAFDLGSHTDCDRYGFCAALKDGDVDWYTYHGSDTFGCDVAPFVQFDAPNLHVCQYYQCDTVPTLSTCPDGTTPDTAPNGAPGCCGTVGWEYDPCDGGLLDSEDARVWIKVERTAGSGCEPYALSVEF